MIDDITQEPIIVPPPTNMIIPPPNFIMMNNGCVVNNCNNHADNEMDFIDREGNKVVFKYCDNHFKQLSNKLYNSVVRFNELKVLWK